MEQIKLDYQLENRYANLEMQFSKIYTRIKTRESEIEKLQKLIAVDLEELTSIRQTEQALNADVEAIYGEGYQIDPITKKLFKNI